MTFEEKKILRPEDWTALEQFDRNTGNILKYDQLTGQLDKTSRKILRETNVLKRLIDSGLILPGGWLTLKGLKECEARQSSIEKSFNKYKVFQPDQNDLVQEKINDNHNNQNLVSHLLSPQAEKFLKSIWNKSVINPVNSKPGTLKNHEFLNDEKNQEKIKHDENDYEKYIPASNPKILYDENAISKNLITYSMPQSFEAEQFKILRTQIFFPKSGIIPRIVSVSSAIPGQGKSFISANLAVSIAKEIDRFVLLIDCDLRKPTIHTMFGFNDNLPGLSDYLSQKNDLSSLLLQTKVEKLTLLPAGSSVENPSELLSSERMASMLQEVSGRYPDRLVILDTTPVTITAEALSLIRYSDFVLLVSRQGYTKKSHLKDLIKMVDHEKILGIVLNNVDMKSLTQYEYKKYVKKYYYNKPKN